MIASSCFNVEKLGKGRVAYLQQPIASTVEGGDDGGVDVAAIQTLERGDFGVGVGGVGEKKMEGAGHKERMR